MQQAVAIFIHSLRQVFGNLAASLRVSALPYAVLVIATIMLASSMVPADDAADIAGVSNAVFGKWLLTLAVFVITSLAIAVNWHRFILLNEPARLLPSLHGRAMGGYLWRIILIGLILLALVVPVLMLMGTVFGGSTLLALVVVVMGIVLNAIVFRLSVSLPAIALGREMSISEGWASMADLWPTLLGLAVITSAAQFGLGLATSVVAFNMTLLMVAQAVANWVTIMVGLSILTTLYGHYVEGRRLL